MNQRRQKIEEMLRDDPEDVFLRYSLAMEWRKEEKHDECLTLFRKLTISDPPYVPAFFMAAQQLVDLERISEARAFLRDGIEQARIQGDGHAAAEMGDYLVTLGDLGEQ